MSHPDQHTLAEGTLSLGIQLDQYQLAQFSRFQALLQDWNRNLNLTSIVDAQAIQLRHFLDSLSCTTVTGELTGQRLIDVGAGAGFPGLPLKILYPGLYLTLVESTTKKCRFLEAVIVDLNLDDVPVINERVEHIGRQAAHREKYDWAVARAVSSMSVLAEYLLPLVRVGGHVLAQKGADSEAEIAAAGNAFITLGGERPQAVPVAIPGIKQGRYLVVAEKVAQTPALYPRRTGVPAKKPLR